MKVLEVNWGLAETFAQYSVASGVWHSFPHWDVTHAGVHSMNTSFGTKRTSHVKMPAVRQHWPSLQRQHVCQSARLQFSMPTKLLADPLHTSLDIRFSHHLPSDCQAEQVHILHPPSEHRSPQRHSAVPLSVLSIVIIATEDTAVQHDMSFLTWRHKRLM